MFLEKLFTSLCFLNLFKLWICWEPCKYRLGKFNCLWTLPYHLYLFSQIDAFKGALQELLVLIKKWVFQDYLIPPLISTCKAHKLRENTRHTMLHTRLYISGQIQKICFLQSNIAICLRLYGTSVLQNLFDCYYFRLFFVSETVFAWFAIGFHRFFSLFCKVLGAFWGVPIMVLTEKKHTYICEEHINRESNKGFFCVSKLDCKSFLNVFGLKNRQCCLRRWQWKRKETLRMLLGQIIDHWSNGHGRTRGFHALDSSCNFLLKWRRQIKRIRLFGSFDLGIQEENVNIFMRFIRFNVSVK